MQATPDARPVTWHSLQLLMALTLGLAGASALLSRSGMPLYHQLTLPVFAPPGWLFPAVWSVLYPLMALCAWLRLRARPADALPALGLYLAQLLTNGIWPLLFFLQSAFGLAFVWLVLTCALAMVTCARFFAASRWAGGLFLPYILWLCFAAVLNFSIARLNP